MFVISSTDECDESDGIYEGLSVTIVMDGVSDFKIKTYAVQRSFILLNIHILNLYIRK